MVRDPTVLPLQWVPLVFDTCSARLMSSDDLETVLAWRNHQEIRHYMLNGDLIGIDEHRAWFSRASLDSSRILLIIEEESIPFGFAQFGDIDYRGVAEWGFYVCPAARKGSGRKLAFCALRYVFEMAGLRKIYGRVVDSNIASIAFHKMIGFKEEQAVAGGAPGGASSTLIIFGLDRSDWAPERLKYQSKYANN